MWSDSSCDERRPHESYRDTFINAGENFVRRQQRRGDFSEAPASPCLACIAVWCDPLSLISISISSSADFFGRSAQPSLLSLFCSLLTLFTIFVVPTFYAHISLPTRFHCCFAVYLLNLIGFCFVGLIASFYHHLNQM
jgi:hypothetical protein